MDTKQEITACAFIYNDKGQLLIGKRTAVETFLPNKYELLGGHVEFGESMDDCLVRELKEEMNIDIVIGEPFDAFTYTFHNNTIHAVEVIYLATMKDKTQPIVADPQEHSEFRWITEDEVDTYYDDGDREKEAVKKGFALLKKRKLN